MGTIEIRRGAAGSGKSAAIAAEIARLVEQRTDGCPNLLDCAAERLLSSGTETIGDG